MATSRQCLENGTTRRTPRLALAAVLAVAPLLGVAGCGHDISSLIPPTATPRSEGNGNVVSYTSDTSGFAYVWDQNDQKLVWSGKVERGDNVAVDSQKNEVRVNLRVVHNNGVPGGHTYRIYFDPHDK